jgi:hypothetical protein
MTVPILGEKRAEIPGQMSIEDIDPETQELLARQAAETNTVPDKQPATTAFLVIIDPQGGQMATGDLSVADTLDLARQATADDMYGACSVLLKDISTTEAAMRTQQAMAQFGAAMAQQQQAAALAAQVKAGVGLPQDHRRR